MDVIDHYDLLIEEQNDPFRDPPVLQEYMSKWDGEPFLEALELSKDKSVLEIGIGTGRDRFVLLSTDHNDRLHP